MSGRHHPFPIWSMRRLLERVDHRRTADLGMRRLGGHGSLVAAGHDSRGRLLGVYLIHDAEADLRFDRRRSWRHLLVLDTEGAGGVVLLPSATLAGPSPADVSAMRDALGEHGWELVVGTDAAPEQIRRIRRDLRVRELWRQVRRRRRIEVHPASESPPNVGTFISHHAWTENGGVHIGLCADPKPEDLGHELMHIVLADEGYPNALRFVGCEGVDTIMPLCGILDVEVDRRLEAVGFDFADTLDHAREMTEAELGPAHWTPHYAALVLFGRLRRLPQEERHWFEDWARSRLPEPTKVALELDRLLPRELAPVDIALGVLVAATRLEVDLGFMIAPFQVDGPAKVPAWQRDVLMRAEELGVRALVAREVSNWSTRPIVQEDWTEAA